MNIYTEVIVSRRMSKDPEKTKKIIRGACWLLTIVAVLFNLYLLIPAAFLWLFYAIAKRLVDLDYEYIQTNDVMDIDVVMGGFSRSTMMTFPLSQVLIVAPWNSDALEEYSHIKARDLSARDPLNKPYVMVCIVKEETKKLYLQLNDEMLRSLKQVIPEKVITQ